MDTVGGWLKIAAVISQDETSWHVFTVDSVGGQLVIVLVSLTTVNVMVMHMIRD